MMNGNEFEKLFLEIFGEFVKKPKQVEKLYLDVIKRYSSKVRFYHNLEHIYLMCDLWVQHRDKIQMPSFVFMAIVYHDIIYKIHKSDNEEQSAEYFHNIAFKNHFSLEANEIVYIKDLIRYTKHNCFFDLKLHKDAQFLLDFDLAVLSKSEDVYYQYTIDIRKEYKRYPNFLYKNGRAGVLKGFLDKEQIYLTKEFSCFEEKARKNIENEINLLTSSKKIKAV